MFMIIDGKSIAAERLEQLRLKIKVSGLRPKLAVVLVGNDPASVMYVNLKKKRAEEVGIAVEIFDSVDVIESLNKDFSIHGILVQLPLPKNIDTKKVLRAIDPAKDVDGLTGRSDFMPATVRGILTALEGFEIQGNDVTIIGRSREVGRPLALAMIDLGATVTVCNSKTKDLRQKTKNADILISATGQPGLVTADMVKLGAVVIDVGSPKGDVDFANVSKIASAITPVPGGIGPLTVVSLLENTYEAAKIQSITHDRRI